MSVGRRLFWIVFLGAASYYAVQRIPQKVVNEDDLVTSTTPAKPFVSGQVVGVDSFLPPAPAGPPRRILFIGNSLTYTWAMPQMLVGLARAGGINLESQQFTPGGSRLSQNVKSLEVQRMLAAGNWNEVVIQEQSQWPSFSDIQVKTDVDPAVNELATRARNGSPSVRVVLYLTPAQRDGDPVNAPYMAEVATYDGMQNRVSATYRRLGRELGGTVVPAGEAWRMIRHERPDLVLYGDDRHPTKTGAYLIACVFYATLFDRTPVGSSFTAGLDPAIIGVLQEAAWSAALREKAR